MSAEVDLAKLLKQTYFRMAGRQHTGAHLPETWEEVARVAKSAVEAELVAETALAAQLEIARKALEEIRTRMSCAQFESAMDVLGVAITQLSDPAATLAEHDKRVAQKCIKTIAAETVAASLFSPLLDAVGLAERLATAIRREFGLQPG